MTKQVYIVALTGIELYEVQHVCLREETAREKFTDLRINLIKQAQDSISRINGQTNRSEGSKASNVEWLKEHVQELQNLEYPGTHGDVYECPLVELHMLLE